MLNVLKHQVLTLLWAAFVLVICNAKFSQSVTGSPLFFDGFDKLTHTGCFFTFTVLMLRGRVRQLNAYSYRASTILIIFVVTALFGGAIEILQKYVFTWRSAEWWDFACDMLGCCMALFSYVVMHGMRSAEIHHAPRQPYARPGKMTVSIPLGDEQIKDR